MQDAVLAKTYHWLAFARHPDMVPKDPRYFRYCLDDQGRRNGHSGLVNSVQASNARMSRACNRYDVASNAVEVDYRSRIEPYSLVSETKAL